MHACENTVKRISAQNLCSIITLGLLTDHDDAVEYKKVKFKYDGSISG